VTASFAKRIAGVGVAASMALSVGCGDVSQGQAPAQVVIDSLVAAPGATPTELTGSLQSDVVTDGTIYNDVAEVTMRLRARDPGSPGVGANPSFLNSVTINQYRVEYIRTDGQGVQGVDVPYAFTSALTFTVSNDAATAAGFQLVRHSAKEEAPLRALRTNGGIISTIARVTFYGQDLAGNAVTVVGQIGIDFGDFADPD